MAEASGGGKAKDGRRWSSAKQVLSFAANKIPWSKNTEHRHDDVEWQDVVNRAKILRGELEDEILHRAAAGGRGRRRSSSDSDLLHVSPRSPNTSHRLGLGLKKFRNVVKDFTLYEEEEEEVEDMFKNTSGFIIYEEGTDTESKDGTGSDREEGYTVNAILPNGVRVQLSGQRGMRVRDLIAALITENKVQTSPRVKLAIYRIPINEDADASMLHNQTIILENRDEQDPQEATDRRKAILMKMLATQKDYHDLIQSALSIYQQPLQKLPSLCNSDSKMLFGGLNPLLKLSSTLIEQLEESLSTWDSETTEIGHMFHKDLWLEYGKYYTNYKMAKLLLLYLRHHNSEFVTTCKELRGAARHSLDSLLLLPPSVSRALTYGSPSPSKGMSPVKIAAAKVVSKYRKRNRSSPVSSPVKPKKTTRMAGWSEEEMKALVQHVAMPSQHWDRNGSEGWPSMSATHPYWQEAAEHIATVTGQPIRTASSVRTRVTKKLAKEFIPDKDGTPGIELAEKDYGLDSIETYQGLPVPQSQGHTTSAPSLLNTPAVKTIRATLGSPTPPACKTTQTPPNPTETSTIEHLQTLSNKEHVCFVREYAKSLDHETLTNVTNAMFLVLAESMGISSYPSDFPELATKAMVRLQQAGKPDVMHHFAKCLGTNRPGTDTPLLLLDRMPFGLIEYQVEFFSSTNSSQVKTPADYRHWLQMMESEFGERFVKLFRGPMWSGYGAEDPEMKDPLKARVNVACIGHRTLTQDLANSQFTTTPEIQEQALQQLKDTHPNGKYWIKLDGTDIKSALQESRRKEWNGDVDLLDGNLQKLKSEYDGRRKLACDDVNAEEIVKHLKEDHKFLLKTLQATLEEYEKKLKTPTTSKEKIKELNWTIVEVSNLIKTCETYTSVYSDDEATNLDVLHRGFKDNHLDYLRFLYAKKRNMATHVLVLMLSEEERRSKPYALPVQYLPYHSLTDNEVKKIVQDLKTKMMEYELTCVGTVTDGEFSTLRTKGSTRPLHVAEIISQTRTQMKRLKKTTLTKMFTKVGEHPDGSPKVRRKSCIPPDVITKIATLREEGLSLKKAVVEVRKDLAPKGFSISTWRPHCPETHLETMRTVCAVHTYRAKLKEYAQDGIDFLHHLYVPEVDPVTGCVVHEREDHNHLEKRIGKHTRDGRFGKIRVSRFDEAMRSPTTDLTHAALVGARKQSTKDAEKLLSHSVATFFQQKGYTVEAEYVKTIADWHEATDGRGMSQEERSNANKKLKQYLLNDWTPWWSDECDLSQVDFNRPLDTICGFSRETFIGVTTNIESQEIRRNSDQPPEHPRASTTDDVECFFSLSHRKAHGENITLKEWKINWRKLIWEFTNRMDSTLPFWYWTLNERFNLFEEVMSFDEASQDTPRLHQVQHRLREDSSIMAPGRAFLPAQHRPKIRHRVHRFEVNLPSTSEEQQEHVQQLLQQSKENSQDAQS